MEWMRQIAGVAMVFALLGAALWAFRRRGWLAARAAGRRMQAVERLALAPHHSLCLVRLGGRGILIGLSPSGCTVLESGEWSRFEEVPR